MNATVVPLEGIFGILLVILGVAMNLVTFSCHDYDLPANEFKVLWGVHIASIFVISFGSMMIDYYFLSGVV